MEILNPLYDLKKVKATLFNKALKNNFKYSECEYDQYLDTAFIRLAEPSDDEFTYYLDRNLAIILRESDNEIVALMVEEYEAEFKQKKIPGNARSGPKLECIDASEIVRKDKRLREVLALV